MLIYAGLLIALAGHGGGGDRPELIQVSPVAPPSTQPLFPIDSIVKRSDI